MASGGGAVPFWRAAGMTYITYSNICANLVRNCLKEPYKAEALSREKVHFSLSKWIDGKPEKPSMHLLLPFSSIFQIESINNPNPACILLLLHALIPIFRVPLSILSNL
ncbi:ATP synthase, F1 complex, epsilon subunit, mitochondrial [Sesbania bispinosa]|nr:ATP synthase, F1 complex, epsilon subunit, mitochondrial [Sesbania bispinosa]